MQHNFVRPIRDYDRQHKLTYNNPQVQNYIETTITSMYDPTKEIVSEAYRPSYTSIHRNSLSCINDTRMNLRDVVENIKTENQHTRRALPMAENHARHRVNKNIIQISPGIKVIPMDLPPHLRVNLRKNPKVPY